MANNVSTYLEQAFLNWFKGTAYPSVPTNVYVALYTTMPTSQNGTGAVEVSGGSYARQAVAASGGWSALSASGTAQQMSNANLISFPTATANWGTILGVGIYDASSAGNLLMFGTLSSSQVVNNGATFQIAASALTLSMD